MGWTVCPSNWQFEALTPSISNVTVFENRAFKVVIRVGSNPIGLVSLGEQEIGHTETQKKAHARTHEKVSGETKSADILDFQPPELWENKCLWLKQPSLWHFVTAAPVN